MSEKQNIHWVNADLTGMTFGRLTVLRNFRSDKPITFHNNRWVCVCDCTALDEPRPEIVVYKSRLISGQNQSCGCLAKEMLSKGRLKHGFARKESQHPLYSTWEGIKGRCLCPTHPEYHNYGGRGVTICDRWKADFALFLSDVGPSWPRKIGYSLDRIDPNKNYEPGNTRWASPKEQANNRTNNVRHTVNGETLTQSQLCEKYGISYSTAKSRLRRGWDAQKTFTTPATEQDRSKHYGKWEFQGQSKTPMEWSRTLKISENVLYLRFKAGWSIERILTTPVRHKRNRNPFFK